MLNYVSFKQIVSRLTNDLLIDIIAGHGEEMIPVPQKFEDDSTGFNDNVGELQQFWCGKDEITKYEKMIRKAGAPKKSIVN